MDVLSPLDALFLEAEDADPHTSMAIASLAVFSPPAPTYAEFLEHFGGRVSMVARYRQKVRRVPFDLGPPRWVDDPDVDLTYHVRATAVPPPGGDEQVATLIARIMSARLDRERPLWEYWLIDGLAGGRWALLSKVHHSMVDGISGTDLYRVILDPTPDPSPPGRDDWDPRPPPSDLRLVAEAIRDLALSPIALARLGAGLLARPVQAARDAATAARGALQYALVDALPATDSSLTGRVGSARRFAWARLTRDDVDAVRRVYGGTLNDVVLAAVTGGYRDLLIGRGEDPKAHAVRSLVPVSTRANGALEGVYDNRVSALVADLPVHIEDPVHRFDAVRAHLAALKAGHEAETGVFVTALAGAEPFPLFARQARFVFAHPQRVLTAVTTNVPGPRVPLYAMGRRALEIVPYVPVARPVRVGVAIFTYCDAITVGVTGDRDTAPDVDVLAAGVADAARELAREARIRAATR